ncbi:UTP--glucose-1-phosphate uridylyltransferase GalU [Lysinibacillus parviboronicapiens]|uniref:UTP--glucose-1-phosphate uridylyltransferase GalU n=1 Tax=Lysinibacillus parviboronicapiens TaxID=436516 RepID=UPI0006D21361|nr:UTP--glucose-1-phosphate uridylyltransferase GalU [Lysinibacillus parviboronicapiens]
MQRVRKAVIPAAGLGTRFLPATKAQPKEMLPIVDKPTIQYIVEEAVASGIEDIIIISGRNKRSIEDHFDTNYELEHTLEMKDKLDDLKEIEAISNLANIHYIRQKEAKGLGDAIYCAHRFIGDEPFAVLLGDIILQAHTPALKQLIDTYDREKVSVIGVQQVPMESVHKYGVIDPVTEVQNCKAIEVKGFIEKPSKEAAPSNYAIMGRYVLTPSIFEKLEATEPGAGGEIQLTDAIQLLNQEERVVAQDVLGQLYDIGSKIGFVQATIDFALQREDLKDDIQAYINTKAEVTK